MIDLSNIRVKAGNGGRGAGSFLHIKGKRRGKADGGDGGLGGNVYFEASRDLNTLEPYRFNKDFKAKDGIGGLSKLKNGAGGEDLVLKVPIGTEILFSVLGSRLSDSSQSVGQLIGHETEKLKTDKLKSENRQQRTDNRIVYDLIDEGQRVLVARGGEGGRGNAHLRDEYGRRPLAGEAGEEGEFVQLKLELKLIADVGLIGLPNAGKSTLLAALTAARPAIADYPFTTLEPNLGVLQFSVLSSRLSDDGRSVGQLISHETEKPKTGKPISENGRLRTDKLILADIPGLIEGASRGRGLGYQFLRHIERTKLLLHLIDSSKIEVSNLHTPGVESGDRGVTGPWEDYQKIRNELKAYSKVLARKKEIVVITKIDLVQEADSDLIKQEFKKHRKKVIFISAKSGRGLDLLTREIVKKLKST